MICRRETAQGAVWRVELKEAGPGSLAGGDEEEVWSSRQGF